MTWHDILTGSKQFGVRYSGGNEHGRTLTSWCNKRRDSTNHLSYHLSFTADATERRQCILFFHAFRGKTFALGSPATLYNITITTIIPPCLVSLHRKNRGKMTVSQLCFHAFTVIRIFAGFQARSQNCEKRLLASSRPSVCPSIHMEHLSSHKTDFDETWYLGFFFLENL
jgi:hypothetical protein